MKPLVYTIDETSFRRVED